MFLSMHDADIQRGAAQQDVPLQHVYAGSGMPDSAGLSCRATHSVFNTVQTCLRALRASKTSFRAAATAPSTAACM